MQNFVPEKFWSIKVVQHRDEIDVTFSWRRNRLFDRMSIIILFERCLTARIAKISKLQKKPTSKWRPLPLTTVELQKLGSMFLRMDSQRVMKVNRFSCLEHTFPNQIRSLRIFIQKAGLAILGQKPIRLIKESICVN